MATSPNTDPTPRPPAEALQRADAAFIAGLSDVVSIHPNESRWWNNASFALPLLGCVGCVVLGLLVHKAEAIGFGLFLGAITAFMLPVVLLSWRGTPTVIVLTTTRALGLHGGRVLRDLPWAEVTRIERVETMGNVRWRIMPRTGQHLAIEGEIADVPALLEQARTLAGLDVSSERA